MMMKKTAKIMTVLTVLAVLAAGNAEAAFFGTDVVGQSAVTSFAAMLEALEVPPAADEDEGVWVLTAPDGGAAFWWRKEAKDARMFDAYLSFDAGPFVNAGLDLSKLPLNMKGMLEERGKIVVGAKLSKEPLVYEGDVTPLSSFEQIVKLDRDSVGYHSALDHYGVTVSEGSLLEWAKDMSKNDKDLVFVLNPQVFIDAGVDPSKVEGWVFDKVTVEDARGRKYDADKFLKPFDLK
ncbi:MAG: hypothetical protein LBQ42_06540 [Synergistaceae bacterium]|jgi:hypothetical protein|nr:hypothetical protein [Synergistaceae bacterium]